MSISRCHSHSIVPGDFDVMSRKGRAGSHDAIHRRHFVHDAGPSRRAGAMVIIVGAIIAPDGRS